MDTRIEIDIPEPFTEMLMTQAAEQGVPVEELFEQMLRNYLERRECNAD